MLSLGLPLLQLGEFHRTSTCIVCLRVFSKSVTALESQDAFSPKSCLRGCFQEQERDRAAWKGSQIPLVGTGEGRGEPVLLQF